MHDKCPWCGARNYEDVERELEKLARMQPVIDAAVAWSTLSGSRVDLLLAIEKYEESELHAR